MRSTIARVSRLVLATLAISTFAKAAEIELHSVLFPERAKTEIKFIGTRAAPAASLDAVVRATKGQSEITLKFTGMKPAILFGGEISAYVVWAVASDGSAENLGELWVREPDGDTQFRTGLRNFALIVTAESFPGKRKPGERVLFMSQPPAAKRVKSSAFKFSNFGATGKWDHDSIATLDYKGPEPVDLVQARRVYAVAMEYGATQYDAAKMEQAKLTLTQAENLAKGGDRKLMVDYARRTVALASDAIGEATNRKAAEQAAAEEVRRQAQLSSLRSEADRASEEANRAAAEAERSALEATRVSAQLTEVERQRALLATETMLLAKERDELKKRLEGALGQVSNTKTTARGLVVNLGDILFDVNKSTLKPETQQTVAKLAGILLMTPSMNVRIEGHTDSTGKEETNLTLSEARAKQVYNLLSKHGIAQERLAFHGYGSSIPVTDNDTKEGRAQNRRVELVIKEGLIQAAETP
jgi:outer membrane protein OmpA-like peptidoglycan-associated protein